MSNVINTRTQSFVQALACKRDNATLSPKTLRKLTVIANREFGGRADHVFRKGLATAGFNGDAAGLRRAISSQLHSVRSPDLRQILSQWLGRLPAPEPRTGQPAQQAANVTAWLASTAAYGVTQWDELPAAGIPPVDYLDDAPAVPIPQPDYDDAPDVVIPPVDYEEAPALHEPVAEPAAQSEPESEPILEPIPETPKPETPLPENGKVVRHVRFNDVVEVIHVARAEVPGARQGRSG